MVKMNKTLAKMLLIINQLSTDLRYAEYIADKMGIHRPNVSADIRSMERAGWLKTSRYKQRKLITNLDEQAVKEAVVYIDAV